MDLRVIKTRNAIKNAFLELRAKKSTEKISIKELTELANINKATFYLHYHDIYDLAETLEREAVCDCLKNIKNPEFILSDTKKFMKQLAGSMYSNEQLMKILFEGNRSSSFTKIFEEELYKIIYSTDPDFKQTVESRMRMTFLIHGSYHTYFTYQEYGIERVMQVIESLLSDEIKNMR